MPHQLWITAFLNKYLGGFVNSLLAVFHLHSDHPQAPIPNFVAMQLFVFALLILYFVYVRMRLSVDDPGVSQHLVESINSFVTNQAHEVIGHGYQRYIGYLSALGMYILINCIIGVIPSLESPAAVPSVPLGCALVTWFYYHFQGVRENGFRYIKNFIGPAPALAVLLFPIEVFSHLARILSLTIRLYANMFASEMVTLVFFSLFPFALPVPFIMLHIAVAIIQTYIFVLLATVYIGEAVAHEH